VDPSLADFVAALDAIQTPAKQAKPVIPVIEAKPQKAVDDSEREDAIQKIAQRPAPPATAPPKKRAKAAPRPAQDEWGMFDPQQCGFAALLTKLDAMAEEEPKEKRKRR
jgi:hypothetical protein